MYRDGSMVTLVNAKEHFDGQDTLKLGSGVCGMIVQSRKKTQGEPEYVVDFAAIIWREKDGELTQEAIDTRKAIFSNGLKVKHIISYINLFTNHLISDDNS